MPGSHTASNTALSKHLVKLLKGNLAHIDFDDAVKNFPVALRGKRPSGSPHSAWELLEHMRIAQWDILEFIRNPKHISPKFPGGYWPKSPKPPNSTAWNKTVQSFRKDHKAMMALVSNKKTGLFAKIPHGDGQTVLQEALTLADHTAYHLGQLMFLRKMLETRNS